MADFKTYYKLQDEEQVHIAKTCETLKSLSENKALDANFHFSLILRGLQIILSNNDTHLRLF